MCRSYLAGNATFASPLPVGFLICSAEPGGCDQAIFAPVYRNREWGDFTGVGGGFVSKSATNPSRYGVSGLVRRLPVY